MKSLSRLWMVGGCLGLSACATLGGRPDQGAEESLSEGDRAALTRVGQKVRAEVVWSSSRLGNHDLFLAQADGSGLRPLTQGDQVDWFPRFAPDGQRVLFCRSKKGWVYERDANRNWLWDLFTIQKDGSALTLVAADATWGTWLGPERIQFARNSKVFHKDLASGQETLIVDSDKEPALGGAELQQPQLSPDGKFLALTLRGAKRETGLFDLQKRTWVATGEGCQINWFPAGDRIYWVNPSGNGGSEVFSIGVALGKPDRAYPYEQMRFIDIPGRRSHEYFPKLSADGKWLVWAATQRGHDHDIADYEIFVWEVGAPPESAARLSFHLGNDRWPDIFVSQ